MQRGASARANKQTTQRDHTTPLNKKLEFFGLGSHFWFLVLFLGFLVSKPCFLSFSTRNHAESSRNSVKKSALNPKHAKLDQKSWFGHVRTWKVVIWSCPDLKMSCPDLRSRKSDMSGPAKTCPGGQVLTANQRKYFYFSDFTPQLY